MQLLQGRSTSKCILRVQVLICYEDSGFPYRKLLTWCGPSTHYLRYALALKCLGYRYLSLGPGSYLVSKKSPLFLVGSGSKTHETQYAIFEEAATERIQNKHCRGFVTTPTAASAYIVTYFKAHMNRTYFGLFGAAPQKYTT